MKREYLARMRARLHDFEAYEACLCEPPYKGVRVNTLKITAEEFRKIAPFPLRQIEWERNGFYVSEEKPGKFIGHDAGLFYVQEPSAMCAAPLLSVRPGEKVLDLCSAPGGKGTQLAQAMQGEGIIVLNEKIPARAKILLQNVERLGIRNAVVTCADPETLAERFVGYFDKILVDAPCSGEGMLRKEPAAAENWSEENVRMCAERQKKILASAAKMLTAGGALVYSTCTFAEEEDEQNAEWFVETHHDFRLREQLKIYPHRAEGEGHFAALFHKEGESAPFTDGGAKAKAFRKKERSLSAPQVEKRALALYREFESVFLKEPLCGRIVAFGTSLCLIPEDLFALDGLRVLRAGLKLGDVGGGRFEPAHALAMGENRRNFSSVLPLSAQEAAHYLAGEELDAPEGFARGWCVVAVDGYPVGIGKNSGGAVKNKLPKGLRR